MQSFSKATCNGDFFFSDILFLQVPRSVLELRLEEFYPLPEMLVHLSRLPRVVLDLLEEGSPLPWASHFGEVIEFLVREWHMQNGFIRIALRYNKTPQNCRC